MGGSGPLWEALIQRLFMLVVVTVSIPATPLGMLRCTGLKKESSPNCGLPNSQPRNRTGVS